MRLTLKTWVGSPMPEPMPLITTLCVPAFSRIAAGLAIVVSVGAWLTGLTVTVNCCEKVLTPPLEVPPLSVTVTVITAVPLRLGCAEKVSEPVVLGLL